MNTVKQIMRSVNGLCGLSYTCLLSFIKVKAKVNRRDPTWSLTNHCTTVNDLSTCLIDVYLSTFLLLVVQVDFPPNMVKIIWMGTGTGRFSCHARSYTSAYASKDRHVFTLMFPSYCLFLLQPLENHSHLWKPFLKLRSKSFDYYY